MKPKISFVIPAHNAEAWLGEAIDSCLAQTVKEIEIVVVDDGSTDSTANVLAHFQKADKRLHPISYPEAQGRGMARNIGCINASASILAMLDADDICDRKRAFETLKAFEDGKDKYVHGGAVFVDAMLRALGGYTPTNLDLKLADVKAPHLECGIVHSTAAFTKTLWQKFPFDEGEYQAIGLDDWQMQMRLLAAGVPVIGLPTVLGAYRQLGAGVSKTRDPKKVAELKLKFMESLHAGAAA